MEPFVMPALSESYSAKGRNGVAAIVTSLLASCCGRGTRAIRVILHTLQFVGHSTPSKVVSIARNINCSNGSLQ